MPAKLAGFSFQSNLAGYVARVLPLHFTRNQKAFKIQKNSFLFLQSNFRNLTTSQKNNWLTASINYPQLDKCGTTYYLDSIQLFNKINSASLIFDGTIKLIPPIHYTIPGNAGFIFSRHQVERITIKLAGFPFNFRLACQVWAAPWSQVPLQNPSYHFTALHLFKYPIPEFIELLPLLSSKYGSPHLGQYVNVKIRWLDSNTLLWSDFFQLSVRLEPPVPM